MTPADDNISPTIPTFQYHEGLPSSPHHLAAPLIRISKPSSTAPCAVSAEGWWLSAGVSSPHININHNLKLQPPAMASYAFRKVDCVDPCDARGFMTRQLALLVVTHSAPNQTDTNDERPLGWLPESILVNPVRIVDKITEDTVIQNIQVIDPVFGHQIVQYITNRVPIKCFNTSDNQDEIKALWQKAKLSPVYIPGSARASTTFTPNEVMLDGTRSDFTVCPTL